MTLPRPFCCQSRAPRASTAAAAIAVAAAAGLFLFSCLLGRSEGAVFLTMPSNASFVFDDADAAFGGIIPAAGMQGYLRRTIPYDACETVLNPADPVSGPVMDLRTSGPVMDFGTFALIERGNCAFDIKVLNAQLAGYSAAIIYNNQDGRDLITMSGRNMWEVAIPAVFVTLNSGQQMISLLEQPGVVCYILPTFDSAAWSVMTASFVSLLAVSAILTTLMYLRRHRLRHAMAAGLGGILGGGGGGERAAPLPSGMSPRAVKALPEVAYHGAMEGCLGMETCAICLEDYVESDRLRVLPCQHEFHVDCVDHWLTKRRPFCPICKRDAHNHQSETDEEAADSSASSAPAAAGAVSGTGSIASRSAAAVVRWASSLMPRLLRPSSSLTSRTSRLPVSLTRSSSSALATAREPFLRPASASSSNSHPSHSSPSSLAPFSSPSISSFIHSLAGTSTSADGSNAAAAAAAGGRSSGGSSSSSSGALF